MFFSHECQIGDVFHVAAMQDDRSAAAIYLIVQLDSVNESFHYNLSRRIHISRITLGLLYL